MLSAYFCGHIMLVKIIHWLGIAAGAILIASCFMHWAYYPDLKESFTGFYTGEKSTYGKPGKLLTAIGLIALILMIIPKVWAKRVNLFLTALGLGYAIKTYVSFAGCYNGYCPEKEAGLWLMLISSILLMVAAVFPQLQLENATPKQSTTEEEA
jgi:hypothetical protein